MSTKLQKILQKSGKHTSVTFKNKEKRKGFDETFTKKKMEIAEKLIGNKSVDLAKKLQQ